MPDAKVRANQTRFVSVSRRIDTRLSLTGGGQGNQDLVLSLVNDTDPAPFSYYGTDIFGNRGWFGTFGPSGNLHAAGLVPDPGPTAGTTRFLCETGKWVVVTGGGTGGAVDSVFGRTGDIVAEEGDYDEFYLTQAEGDGLYQPLDFDLTLISTATPAVKYYYGTGPSSTVKSFYPLPATAGKTEVYSAPEAPAPQADYLMWIDTDAPDAANVAGSDKNYVHNQVTPSTSWSVNHGLDKYPAVDVVDSGQSVLIPDVHYVDTNNVTLGFGAATSGKAYFN